MTSPFHALKSSESQIKKMVPTDKTASAMNNPKTIRIEKIAPPIGRSKVKMDKPNMKNVTKNKKPLKMIKKVTFFFFLGSFVGNDSFV